MWFAARDVAFENPLTEDMRRPCSAHGHRPPGGGTDLPRAAAMMAERLWPDDVDFDLEMMITRMVRLLLIEISAFHGFAWAEALLADPDLVAGDGEAARLVSYIRADETPHVDYLRTALSELRDRTIVGEAGDATPAPTWWAHLGPALAQSLGANRRPALDAPGVRCARRRRAPRRRRPARPGSTSSARSTARADGTWVEATTAA